MRTCRVSIWAGVGVSLSFGGRVSMSGTRMAWHSDDGVVDWREISFLIICVIV